MRAVHSVQSVECRFNHADIVFSMKEFAHVKPHEDDSVVVKLWVKNYITYKVLLNQTTSTNIVYRDTFEKLGLMERT